jgi:hypothetical protein
MPSSFPEAERVVEQHVDELGVTDPAGYLRSFSTYLELKPEDARKAVSMAVDASKTLISIGVALFTALGAILITSISAREVITFSNSLRLVTAFAAALTIVSMWSGFMAIGKAYRRGQRPGDAAGPPWATRAISSQLGFQSLTGLGALFLFALAVGLWTAGSKPTTNTQTGSLEARIDTLNIRLDQQAGDITKLGQGQSRTAVVYGAISSIQQQLRAISDAIGNISTQLAERPSVPQPKATETKTSSPPGRESDLTSSDWMKIQSALAQQGFNAGPIDGEVGNRTRRAIRAYQALSHAPATGYLTPQQIEALLSR